MPKLLKTRALMLKKQTERVSDSRSPHSDAIGLAQTPQLRKEVFFDGLGASVKTEKIHGGRV